LLPLIVTSSEDQVSFSGSMMVVAATCRRYFDRSMLCPTSAGMAGEVCEMVVSAVSAAADTGRHSGSSNRQVRIKQRVLLLRLHFMTVPFGYTP